MPDDVKLASLFIVITCTAVWLIAYLLMGVLFVGEWLLRPKVARG